MATKTSAVTIKASAKKIWDALTKPELVKQWQYGSNLFTDWKPGSPIRYSTPWEDKVFEQWGTILEVVPHQLIKYNLFAPRPGVEDKPENYFVMSYVLDEKEGHTIVKFIQENNRPVTTPEKEEGEENPILKALKVLVES